MAGAPFGGCLSPVLGVHGAFPFPGFSGSEISIPEVEPFEAMIAAGREGKSGMRGLEYAVWKRQTAVFRTWLYTTLKKKLHSYRKAGRVEIGRAHV